MPFQYKMSMKLAMYTVTPTQDERSLLAMPRNLYTCLLGLEGRVGSLALFKVAYWLCIRNLQPLPVECVHQPVGQFCPLVSKPYTKT